LYGRGQHSLVEDNSRFHCLAMLLPALGAAFNVSEKKRNRAGRQSLEFSKLLLSSRCLRHYFFQFKFCRA